VPLAPWFPAWFPACFPTAFEDPCLGRWLLDAFFLRPAAVPLVINPDEFLLTALGAFGLGNVGLVRLPDMPRWAPGLDDGKFVDTLIFPVELFLPPSPGRSDNLCAETFLWTGAPECDEGSGWEVRRGVGGDVDCAVSLDS
jgi:hypothetical protein